MNTLICGSMAYDTIMVFPDRFKKHILPEQIHILNVSFLVPQMRREYGGCAGNIAYNLNLLGGKPLIMATVGESDFAPYAERLARLGLSQAHVRPVPEQFTGQAFITTDLDDNQITAFHPGAMNFSEHNHVGNAKDVSLGIVSPSGRAGMIQHAKEFQEAGIPFIFDPGQGMPMFERDDLLTFIEQASYVTLNDYEARMLQEKSGLTLTDIAKRVKALVLTLAGEGSVIHADGKEIRIPGVPAEVVDPTGCGDAYRAGLLYGIQQGWDWETSGRLASLLGAIKIAHRGGQNHNPAREELCAQFKQHFGYDIVL